MAKGTKNTASYIEELITPAVNQLGYDIWDVEYVKEGASWYLRITIDSENGIDMDDCEKVHNTIDPIIDEADPIDDFYYLEVSSPGVERNIRTREHFECCVEEVIQVKLFSAIDKKKELIGQLTAVSEDGNEITMLVDGQEINVKRSLISRANVYFDFSSVLNQK